MKKVCVSQDRESTWFSVIYSLRFYPYTETTGFARRETETIGFLVIARIETTGFLVIARIETGYCPDRKTTGFLVIARIETTGFLFIARIETTGFLFIAG